ncbi:hypothetical protein A1359_05545 [Methylomonas lenta]|uniref:Lipoprotein n=2 Tax=Methylomonas lenta TaxID=980561 RepID=A0A177NIM8_9GAMM|nr:hypothetical protein A1359_05545 [Methylomonas lenta]
MFILIRLPTVFACFLLVFFLAACSTGESQTALNQYKSSFDLTLPHHLSATVDPIQFAKCMAPQTAKLKPGFVRFVAKLKTHPQGKLLLADIGLLDDSQLIDSVMTVRSQVQTLFSQFTTDAGDVKDSRIAEIMSDSAINDTEDAQQPSINVDQDMQLLDDLTRSYLKAYFTKPLDVQASAVNETKLRVSLATILNLKPQDQKISNLIDFLQPQLKSSINPITRVGGFIEGDGSQFGFPGVASPTGSLKVNYSQIATEVMRIFLTALRDGLAPIPVLENSTAASLQYDFDILQFGLSDQPITLEWHMDRHDASKVLSIRVSPEQFENIESNARQVEASVASSVGKAVRGGSMGSLNNEAVAQLLETVAGVLAKHKSQRAQWCLLAQDQSLLPNSSLVSDQQQP